MHPHHPRHPYNGNGNHHLHGLGDRHEESIAPIVIMGILGLLVFFTTTGK